MHTSKYKIQIPCNSFQTLLTVEVVLECAYTLLKQAHHSREEKGFCTRVHLHLLIQSLTSEDYRLLRNITKIWLLINFNKENISRTTKREITDVISNKHYLFFQRGRQCLKAFPVLGERRVMGHPSNALKIPVSSGIFLRIVTTTKKPMASILHITFYISGIPVLEKKQMTSEA